MTSVNFRLGVDYGTSNTVAMLAWPDGRSRPLLFDGSPTLPSAVSLEPDGRLLVGVEAARAARVNPGGVELNPKRRIDETDVLLGASAVALVDLIAATLRRVMAEAVRVVGDHPDTVTLTHPAAWGRTRRATLVEAARRAGFPHVSLVAEPTAAAAYFSTCFPSIGMAGQSTIVVYDLGGGTCDVSVVRSTADGLEILAADGLPDFGGVDLDWLLVEQIGAAVSASAPEAWARLSTAVQPGDRRAVAQLREDARAAKETLSRQPTAAIYVPIIDRNVHVTREAFERAATASVAGSAALTRQVIQRSAVAPHQLDGVFLVGGSTRVPAVATALHRALGIAPTVLEQPELVVAEGALSAPSEAWPLRETVQVVRTAAATAIPVDPVARARTFAGVDDGVDDDAVGGTDRHDGPPVGRRPRWIVMLSTGVVVVVIVIAIIAKVGSGKGSSDDQTVRLPDVCQAGDPLKNTYHLVQSSGDNLDDDNHRDCSWHASGTEFTASLVVTLDRVAGSADNAHDAFGKGLDTARSDAKQDQATPLGGVGDEAFVTRYADDPALVGAHILVRRGRVLLDVVWYGGTQNGYGPTTPFSYDQARPQASAVVEELLPKLG